MPGHRKRRQFKQTDAFTRGTVIGLKRAVIVAVYACGVDVEKGPIRQQSWNAPPCDNVESWFGAQSRMIPGCRGQYGEERLQDKIVASYIDPLELTEGTERELDDFRTVFYRSDHSYFEELQDELLSSHIEPLELTEGIEEKFDDSNIKSYRRRRGRENNEEEEVQNFKDPIKEGILKSLPEQAQELLKYGMPGVHHISLMGDDLVIGYDTALRVPRWVLEHLTPDSLSGGGFKRKGSDFFEDKSIHPYFRSTTQDYKGSGFDRGHMAAAGNHKKFSRDYKDTFILSNMAPQVGEDFNRGIWNNLEIYVRDKFVTKYDETFVLTGTLFLPRRDSQTGQATVSYKTIGSNNVAVPSHFFKVVVARQGDHMELESYLMANQGTKDSSLGKFLVPKKDIEKASGLLIFEKIPLESFGCINRKCKTI
ncbi:ENDOG [Cordylochernes scorpioides]|uniref:ENDOG n=1 Tax=Cordylochernes scorpioides TaxID=51811 RepID=A0ABY6KCI2_9ARAC|nr:ENDOG [Cordylochernes scorpioides]